MASLIRNPSPIAETTERTAGNPRQHKAAKIDPPIPILSRMIFNSRSSLIC